MIFVYDMLREVIGRDNTAPSPHFSCRYVKRTGQVADIADARVIRFEKETNTLLVRTPGGARALKIYAIVEYNQQDVFL